MLLSGEMRSEPRPTCPEGLRDRVLGHILRAILRGCVNGRRRRRLRGRIPNGTGGAIALHPSDALTFARFGCDSIDEATSRRLHTSRTSTHDNSGVRIARHASRKRRPGTPSSSCPSFTPRNSSGAHPSIFENQAGVRSASGSNRSTQGGPSGGWPRRNCSGGMAGTLRGEESVDLATHVVGRGRVV